MPEESAIAKLIKARVEKAKTYKTTHDVARALALAHLGHLLHDYPAHAALAASVSRELTSMNAKQAELDAEEKEEDAKELAEAQAADAKMYSAQNEPEKKEEEDSQKASYPSVAPSAPRR